MTHYELLGLEPTASKKDIIRAYRKMAMRYHPDGSHPDVELFKLCKAAYDILSSESERSYYDASLPKSQESGIVRQGKAVVVRSTWAGGATENAYVYAVYGSAQTDNGMIRKSAGLARIKT